MQMGMCDVIILCREINMDTGQIAVYRIEKEPVTGEMIFCLKMRSRFNPELQYFCVLKSRWIEEGAEYEQLLHHRNLTQRNLEAIGGIVRL